MPLTRVFAAVLDPIRCRRDGVRWRRHEPTRIRERLDGRRDCDEVDSGWYLCLDKSNLVEI